MYEITSFEPDDDDNNAGGEFFIRIRFSSIESNDEASHEQWITLRYPSREEAIKQFEGFAYNLPLPNIVKKPQ